MFTIFNSFIMYISSAELVNKCLLANSLDELNL